MVTAPELPVRIVLQARTTSSRLPAKTLLPVGGMPLSVLAARRLARGAHDLVVATSVDARDDLLARTLTEAGLRVVRGPLDDVLTRFLRATEDLPDAAICVRMTSDNCCPDADFVDTILGLYHQSGARYLAYGNDGQWLPYGMSAEICRVGDLRQTARLDAGLAAEHIREHVTPAIRASFAPAHRPAFPDWDRDLGHLRCTVDTLDDYLRVAGLFADIGDPVAVPWRDLVAAMERDRPSRPAPLVLGTVQLGLPYGIRQSAGLMGMAEAEAILETAARCGVAALDSAAAYGESETRIGQWHAGRDLPVITKLMPLDTDGAEAAALAAQTTDSIERSARKLGMAALDTVLLHRAAHLEAAGGAIWRQLLDLRAAGRIRHLGVSVQTPQELHHALSVPEVAHVQLPLNLLDWRWFDGVAALRARPEVTVHVRSVFLQGLLVQPDATAWPAIAGVDGPAILSTLGDLAARHGRESVADLCIAFIRGLSWVDGVVMGVDSAAQLEALAELFTRPPLDIPAILDVQQSLPRLPERFLNPALWGRA